jgi:hypothetical protein
MRIFQRKYLLLLTILWHLHSFGQTQLSEVDTLRIEYPKVIEYLQRQMAEGLRTFNDVKPSFQTGESIEDYHVIDREFLVKDSLEKVWNDYLSAVLQESWNTKTIRFGFCYSRNNDSIYYSNDKVRTVMPGLIVYLNLKLLYGMKQLAVAFEITRIDQDEKMLEFSYLEGNETEGKQQLFFRENNKGNTVIAHLSYYRSSSKARDKLYPHLHAQLINKFHRNMKLINKNKYEH